MGRDKVNDRIWMILIILMATIVSTRMIGANVVHVYDDAFITFRYAKNLATGNGFVYNRGEKILGTTSPLFGIIQAGIYWSGGNLPKIIQCLNTVADLSTVGVVLLCVWRFDLLAGVIFGLIYAAEIWIVRISVGGMEMSLFTALSFASIYLFSVKRKKTAMFLASASYFLRPEGVILVGLLTIFMAKDDYDWRKFIKLSLIPIFTIGIPILVIWVYYGSPISQSVATKSEMVGGNFWHVIQRQYFQNVFHWILFPFVAFGAFQVFDREKFFEKNTSTSFQAIILCWGMLYSLAYIFARPHMWSWYLFPVYATKFFIASIGLSAVGKKFYPSEIFIEKIAMGGGLAIIVIYAVALAWFGPTKITREIYTPMQKWASSISQAGYGKTILAEDIGAIGFYSDAYIYDVAGLVLKKALRGSNEAEIIDSEKPDFVLANASAYNAKVIKKIQREGYKVINNWPQNASIKKLNSGWKQEYLLFARN